MLHLLKNLQNSVNVTVSNESELSNPYYLFVFTHLETRDKVYFIPYNISVPHSERFDTFTFSSIDDLPIVLTGNSVNIHLQQGQYAYTIYDQVTSSNLNPLLSNSVVETGLAWVEQNEVCFETYVSDNDDAEAVIYYSPECPITPWNEVNVNWEDANWDWNENHVLN